MKNIKTVLFSILLLVGAVNAIGSDNIQVRDVDAVKANLELRDIFLFRSLEGTPTPKWFFPVVAYQNYWIETEYMNQFGITINPACDKNISIEGEKLYCAPNGNKARKFVFAQMTDRESLTGDVDENAPDGYIREVIFDEKVVSLTKNADSTYELKIGQ